MPKALQNQTQRFYWASPPNGIPAVQKLDLTAEQKKSVDDIFQQHRLRLIDLEAALQKEELILEPLVAADPPDDAKVLAQIDRVAQWRGELEKVNFTLVGVVRKKHTPDQWKQMQSQRVTLKLTAPKVTIK